jgi:hypothetical protein
MARMIFHDPFVDKEPISEECAKDSPPLPWAITPSRSGVAAITCPGP